MDACVLLWYLADLPVLNLQLKFQYAIIDHWKLGFESVKLGFDCGLVLILLHNIADFLQQES